MSNEGRCQVAFDDGPRCQNRATGGTAALENGRWIFVAHCSECGDRLMQIKTQSGGKASNEEGKAP